MVVGDGVVEVALDRGAVSADGYGSPICELELELKSGAPSLLFDLARDLPCAPRWTCPSPARPSVATP